MFLVTKFALRTLNNMVYILSSTTQIAKSGVLSVFLLKTSKKLGLSGLEDKISTTIQSKSGFAACVYHIIKNKIKKQPF